MDRRKEAKEVDTERRKHRFRDWKKEATRLDAAIADFEKTVLSKPINGKSIFDKVYPPK